MWGWVTAEALLSHQQQVALRHPRTDRSAAKKPKKKTRGGLIWYSDRAWSTLHLSHLSREAAEHNQLETRLNALTQKHSKLPKLRTENTTPRVLTAKQTTHKRNNKRCESSNIHAVLTQLTEKRLTLTETLCAAGALLRLSCAEVWTDYFVWDLTSTCCQAGDYIHGKSRGGGAGRLTGAHSGLTHWLQIRRLLRHHTSLPTQLQVHGGNRAHIYSVNGFSGNCTIQSKQQRGVLESMEACFGHL